MYDIKKAREHLTNLTPDSRICWFIAKVLLLSVVLLTVLFGRFYLLAHVASWVLTTLSALFATLAVIIDTTKERISKVRPDDKSKFWTITTSLFTIGLCCGILENSYSLVSGFPNTYSNISAKALSVLLSSIGASMVFAGLATEFNASRFEPYEIKKGTYQVIACKLVYGFLSVEKHITLLNENGEEDTTIINVSHSAVGLEPSINLCLAVQPGDTIELWYARKPTGYCLVSKILA